LAPNPIPGQPSLKKLFRPIGLIVGNSGWEAQFLGLEIYLDFNFKGFWTFGLFTLSFWHFQISLGWFNNYLGYYF